MDEQHSRARRISETFVSSRSTKLLSGTHTAKKAIAATDTLIYYFRLAISANDVSDWEIAEHWNNSVLHNIYPITSTSIVAPAPDKKQFIRFWCCSVVTDSDRQNFKQWIRLSGDICALRGALVIGVRGCVCI